MPKSFLEFSCGFGKMSRFLMIFVVISHGDIVSINIEKGDIGSVEETNFQQRHNISSADIVCKLFWPLWEINLQEHRWEKIQLPLNHRPPRRFSRARRFMQENDDLPVITFQRIIPSLYFTTM